MLEEARRLRPEGIPCDVLHLDSFWQRAFMWCDFEWDAERPPGSQAAPRASSTARASTTASGSIPYVACQSALYQEGAARGYFLRRPDGSVYDALVWSQRTERGMGLCAHRGLHQSRGRGLVPRQARRPARARRRLVQAGLRRGDPGGRPLRQRADRRRDAQPVSAPVPARVPSRRRRPPAGRARSPGRAARPRASSAIPGTGPAIPSARSWTSRTRCAEAWPRHERARLLEPRHRRLLGRALARAVRPLVPAAASSRRSAGTTARRRATRGGSARRRSRSSASTRASGAGWCRTW